MKPLIFIKTKELFNKYLPRVWMCLPKAGRFQRLHTDTPIQLPLRVPGTGYIQMARTFQASLYQL